LFIYQVKGNKEVREMNQKKKVYMFLFIIPILIVGCLYTKEISKQREWYLVMTKEKMSFSSYSFIVDSDYLRYLDRDGNYSYAVKTNLWKGNEMKRLKEQNDNIAQVIESKEENRYNIRGFNLVYSFISSIVMSCIFMFIIRKDEKIEQKKKLFFVLWYIIFISHTLINIYFPTIPPSNDSCKYESVFGQVCSLAVDPGFLNYIFKTPIDVIVFILLYIKFYQKTKKEAVE
jgi:cytochrome bd-type quinol oxidase subunit 2